MECDLLMRDTVRGSDSRWPGVVVIELPGRDGTVIAHAALDVDHTRRPEVCPGEFFLASPYQLDWFPRSFRQAGCFQRGVAGVFTAIRRSRIRDQDSHILDRNPKSFRQFLSNSEWTLRSGPNREFIVLPFCDGGPRFERHMSDVSDGIGLIESLVCSREPLLNRSRAI